MLTMFCRYWGEDVSAGSASSLSLCQLHQLARERAALRKPSVEGNSVAVEVEEELPMVTQAASGMTSAAVHHKLPDWISSPQLVSADIANDSAPLDSLGLPDVVSANLRDMGCSSFFPVQVKTLYFSISIIMIISCCSWRFSLTSLLSLPLFLLVMSLSLLPLDVGRHSAMSFL